MAITGAWEAALKPEFSKPYYRELYKKVLTAYRTETVYPPGGEIFRAFDLTPFGQVKAVILGQDPYHEPGQANGLCFSVRKDVRIPPSLVNIYKEMHDDLGCEIPANGDLTGWAKQGVLLLNTVLTVRAHAANSHRGIGWEEFTDAAIKALAEKVVFERPYDTELILTGHEVDKKFLDAADYISRIDNLTHDIVSLQKRRPIAPELALVEEAGRLRSKQNCL